MNQQVGEYLLICGSVVRCGYEPKRPILPRCDRCRVRYLRRITQHYWALPQSQWVL